MSEESTRQLVAVVRMLGAELGYRAHLYGRDNLAEREDLRRQFETGELQV